MAVQACVRKGGCVIKAEKGENGHRFRLAYEKVDF